MHKFKIPLLVCWNAGLVLTNTAIAQEGMPEWGLLLDSSGSVTVEDFTARNAGLAKALTNPWLLPAIESGSRNLSLGIYQFSGPGQVGESLAWQVIDDPAAARAAARDIELMSRLFSGGADLDSALLISSILTAGNGIGGSPVTLLILGDGGTAATGIGRNLALSRGVDRISAWVTGEPGDLDGYLSGVVGGVGAEARLFDDPGRFEDEFLTQLFQYFQSPDNTSAAAAAGVGQAVMGGVRFAFEDLNGRLQRARTGAADSTASPFLVKWPTGAKSVPDLMQPAIKWSTFGSVSGGWQHGAAKWDSFLGVPVLTQAAHDLRYESVDAGLEAGFSGGWSIGTALIGYHGDIDLHDVGDGKDQAVGGAVYVSHQRALSWGGLTVYGDVLAGWLDHDVELHRKISKGIAHGETDADSGVFEINIGARRQDYSVIHGPELGLSVLRGGIDSFQEAGAAAVSYPETDFFSRLCQVGYQGAARLELGNVPISFSAITAWEHEFEASDLGPQGADLGGIARDTWMAGIAVRAMLNESASVHLLFENRVAHESDSQLLKLGFDFIF